MFFLFPCFLYALLEASNHNPPSQLLATVAWSTGKYGEYTLRGKSIYSGFTVLYVKLRVKEKMCCDFHLSICQSSVTARWIWADLECFKWDIMALHLAQRVKHTLCIASPGFFTLLNTISFVTLLPTALCSAAKSSLPHVSLFTSHLERV